MDQDKIEYIIQLLNQKTGEKDLNKWLSDKENRKLFDEVCETREVLMRDKKALKVDIDKELGSLKGAIKQSSSYRINWRVSVAASLLLIASSYFFFINEKINKSDSNIISQVIEPGQSKAQLLLDDGRVIDLEKENMRITDGQVSGITNDSLHGLQYKQLELSGDEETIFNTVRVPVGGEYKMTLSDGTQVWLNSETEIRFPVYFSADKREVFLKGEAYFKVAHNAKKPFIANLDRGSIEVLGTEFNVCAYDDEQDMVTTLVNGSVKFTVGSDKKGQVLKPNQQVTYNKNTNESILKDVDTYPFIAWKEGKFYFKSMELDKILRQLERWYNFELFYKNEDLKHYKFRGVILKELSFNEALKIIEETTDIKFRIKGKTVTVYKVY